jgi:hypothetical protein
VTLERGEVSEECMASIIGVTIIGQLSRILTVTNKRSALRKTTRRNIPEDGILQSHSSENFKSYSIE